MKVFVVRLGNMLPDKLHYTLRDYHLESFSADDSIRYTVYLSSSGKVCGHRGAAYMDSQELAESFLAHYKPQLDKRSYGAYTAFVEAIDANKFEQRWLAKTQPKVLAIFDRSPG